MPDRIVTTMAISAAVASLARAALVAAAGALHRRVRMAEAMREQPEKWDTEPLEIVQDALEKIDQARRQDVPLQPFKIMQLPGGGPA
jgi:hypothetical protein